MAKLSAAEKQRLYRQRRDADPKRREDYLAKRHQGYVNDLQAKKRKKIGDLSERERRVQRKQWRVNQARHRHLIRTVQAVLTPESSPERSPPQVPRQRRLGRNVRRIHDQRRRREIQELELKLRQVKKQRNKFRRRYYRCTKQQKAATNPEGPSSPVAARVANLLEGQSVNSPIKETLTYHFALVGDLKQAYKGSKDPATKTAIASIQNGPQIRQHKFQSTCQQELGFSYKAGKQQQRRLCEAIAVKRSVVKQFYLRDDVSRLTTGKKNTITLRKVKKQRRLLCDLLLNLHVRFVSEHGPVSYGFFCRNRPFWVVKPAERDRATCQCKTHENLQFMAETLYKHGLLALNNLNKIVDNTVCKTMSLSDLKPCAYGECKDCKHTMCTFVKQPSKDEVTMTQWCLEKTVTKQGDETEKKSTITVKKDVTLTETELASQFQDRLFKFRKHIFNIRWQYSAYKDLLKNMTNKDCLIHIDFSENYNCKYANEIQSVHFGGSHQQATLHTGVLYVRDQSPLSFTTISPSRRHDPAAIWAHLDPILQMLKTQNPDIQNLHFFSDGPATQYKQKGNFHMLCSEPQKQGFQATTWNYFEASHGKGAPDGVGGALKRSADGIVRHGKDIPDAKTLYQVLKESNTEIKLFFVSEEEVEAKASKMLRVPLVTIKGTMKMHQVMCITPGVLKHRDISCFCQAAEDVWDCPCYNLQEVKLEAMQGHRSEPHTQYRPDVIGVDHCGQWCIVHYDNEPYPGIIQDVQVHGIKVKCMHRSTKYDLNKFFWPCPIEDVNWYGDDQILCFMPEPVALNKRAVQVDEDVWAFVKKLL